METFRPTSVLRYENGSARQDRDEVAVEEPLEIRVRGRAVSVTMRTPGHDDELAAGFLLSEGIVRGAGDILKITPCGRNEMGNLIDVQLGPLVAVDFEKLTRHVFASSSCGLCGKATIDALRVQFPRIEADAAVDVKTLLGLSARMRRAQETFSRTGGLHAAALFTTEGDLIVLREDVGRHNAVDKAIGFALLRGVALANALLLVSGRTSF